MGKRYIFKVKYRNKIIDKIITISDDEEIALETANEATLNSLEVELEEIIEEG